MEAVDHFELSPQVFLCEVVQHPRVHQTLHKRRAVLGQPDASQPVIADPLVVHLPERQGLLNGMGRGRGGGSGGGWGRGGSSEIIRLFG